MDAYLLEAINNGLRTLWGQAVEIWLSGGWAMIAIAANAMVLFTVGMHLYLKLRGKGFESLSEKRWRTWIDEPEQRLGPVGQLLDFIMGENSASETAALFEELYSTETVPFERDLRVMKICVSAAPLLGLLGTVTGMLATFGALASGAGGDKTMELVAQGISEALITTETGLVVALPGLFFQYQLARKHEKYRAFLRHMETVITQKTYKRQRKQEKAARKAAVA